MNLKHLPPGRCLLSTVLLSFMLSGCASFWNVGESKYDCPGIPQGVVCKTPREIYQLTNHRDALITMHDNGKQSGSDVSSDQHKGVLGAQASVTLPQPIQQPMPILEPAQVMRILVTKWIDQNGDLHFPGLIFTEVTPRRWAEGNIESGVGGQILTPVQIDAPAGSDADMSSDNSGTSGGVVVKPASFIQPYSVTATGAGQAGNSAAASQGVSVPGLPVADRTSSGSPNASSPFSSNFSASSGMSTMRPQRQGYSQFGRSGYQSGANSSYAQ